MNRPLRRLFETEAQKADAFWTAYQAWKAEDSRELRERWLVALVQHADLTKLWIAAVDEEGSEPEYALASVLLMAERDRELEAEAREGEGEPASPPMRSAHEIGQNIDRLQREIAATGRARPR